MPAPLYIALIRYANGTLDIRTYTTSATMRADSKCVRIVVDWEDRNKLQNIIRTGRDWPVNIPADQRDAMLGKLNRLIALHDDQES
ncbi:hypothetical protein [uncultured Akkermansia sp.]|uniref:hypothetical protein n=1 Tax=uncultured Akkermansia sp. TaxID=512294 RepID=UPI0025FF20C1|nr:hypothetical protein [uncultured Akkermansia sp.]